jgi:hypothetical protein
MLSDGVLALWMMRQWKANCIKGVGRDRNVSSRRRCNPLRWLWFVASPHTHTQTQTAPRHTQQSILINVKDNHGLRIRKAPYLPFSAALSAASRDGGAFFVRPRGVRDIYFSPETLGSTTSSSFGSCTPQLFVKPLSLSSTTARDKNNFRRLTKKTFPP